MSVIQELFENYEHIPLEFRRQLLMMRELDEKSSSKKLFSMSSPFRTNRRAREIKT